MLLLTVDEDDFERDEDKWNINFRKHTEKKNFFIVVSDNIQQNKTKCKKKKLKGLLNTTYCKYQVRS